MGCPWGSSLMVPTALHWGSCSASPSPARGAAGALSRVCPCQSLPCPSWQRLELSCVRREKRLWLSARPRAVLYCTVLYSNILYCTVLDDTLLHSNAQMV